MFLRENEPLGRHTTLRTGGPARYFVEASTLEEIREAALFARQVRAPVFALGGGSNVLARDSGFPGVVIHIASKGIRTTDLPEDHVEVVAEAGEEWDGLVAFAVGQGLSGLENTSLIPGRVGAAVAGNIGAYGTEVKDTLKWAEAMDIRTGEARQFSREECRPGYRQSFFKTEEGRHFIITRAAFDLNRRFLPNTRYHDLTRFFAERGIAIPNLAEVRDAVIAIRKDKLPDVSTVGTAGSFFKNPVVERSVYESLAGRYPGLPGHPEQDNRIKIPLGWVLDRVCGLKGVQTGKVGTHPAQALVIINNGGSAAEIEALANRMAIAVKEATGLAVEWEVELLEDQRFFGRNPLGRLEGGAGSSSI